MAIILAISVSLLHAGRYDPPEILIKISIEDRDDLHAMAALGVDIWQKESDHITAAVRPSDLTEIIAQGYPVEILIENLDQYFKNLKKGPDLNVNPSFS